MRYYFDLIMVLISIQSVTLVCNYSQYLGPGIVTRRPLILQLVHSASRWKKTKKSESDGSGMFKQL